MSGYANQASIHDCGRGIDYADICGWTEEELVLIAANFIEGGEERRREYEKEG